MAEDSRDVLMTLEITKGNFVPAECTSVIEAAPANGIKDALADGFTHQSQHGNKKTNYFSIEDFTFPVALADETDAKDQMTAEKAKGADREKEVTKQFGKQFADLHERNANLQQQIEDLHDRLAAVEGRKGSAGRKGSNSATSLSDLKLPETKEPVEYSRFMSQGRSAMRAKTYPADLDQISISKQMDQSSTTIFSLCRDSKTLYGASLLKRKAIGMESLRGYLRIDFFDVLITDLNWDEDDVVKEKFKFVCRRAVVQYAIETMTTDPQYKGAAKLIKLPSREWNVLTAKT